MTLNYIYDSVVKVSSTNFQCERTTNGESTFFNEDLVRSPSSNFRCQRNNGGTLVGKANSHNNRYSDCDWNHQVHSVALLESLPTQESANSLAGFFLFRKRRTSEEKLALPFRQTSSPPSHKATADAVTSSSAWMRFSKVFASVSVRKHSPGPNKTRRQIVVVLLLCDKVRIDGL